METEVNTNRLWDLEPYAWGFDLCIKIVGSFLVMEHEIISQRSVKFRKAL